MAIRKQVQPPRQDVWNKSLTSPWAAAPWRRSGYNFTVRRFPLYLALGSYLAASACSKSSDSGKELREQPVSQESAGTENTPAESSPTTGGDLGYGDDARLFDSPAAAIQTLLDEAGDSKQPRIIGFGEYHKLKRSAPVQSALRRFADGMFDVLGPRAGHLVLETWQVDPRCGDDGTAVREQVDQAIERPPETESEMAILLRKMQAAGTAPHVLHFACPEYTSLLTEEGLDTEKLLTLISKKLEEAALAALSKGPDDKMVLIYGGATHNNLYPYEGLEHWSFATSLAKATNQSFWEIDLYVPELIEGDPLLSNEAWYPLLKEARQEQVILIRRDPTSYILILRKGYGDEPSESGGPT